MRCNVKCGDVMYMPHYNDSYEVVGGGGGVVGCCFFFNDPATTEIYTLSLHDALPIYAVHKGERSGAVTC